MTLRLVVVLDLSCIILYQQESYVHLRMKIFSSNLDDPRYNLVSQLYSARWEEGVFRLLSDGHCHTFNPENVSHSGLKGQHYFNLGLCLVHLLNFNSL